MAASVSPSAAPRFLVIQLGDIGDLVLSTPALDALRQKYPAAHIAVLTTAAAAPLLGGTGLADQVIIFRRQTLGGIKGLLNGQELKAALDLALTLRRGHFDTILFFHTFTTRAGSLKFAALSAAAGSKRRIGLQNGNGFFLTESIPDFGFREHRAAAWLRLMPLVGASSQTRPAKVARAPQKFLEPLPPLKVDHDHRPNHPPRIAIHAGSGSYAPARRWEPEKFAAVANALHEKHGAEIVFVGGPGDDTPSVIAAMKAPYTDLTGKTTLPELASVFASCDLFIGADSGVAHIAAAAGTKVITLFGPSNSEAWRPWTPKQISFAPNNIVRCAPCMYVDHTLGSRAGCNARTCMKLHSAEMVVAWADAMLGLDPPFHGCADFPPWRFYPEGYENSELPMDFWLIIKSGRLPRSVVQISILDLPVTVITFDRWMELIKSWMATPATTPIPAHVCTINPEMIMIARRDPIFKVVLQRANVTVPDGVGLLWAAKLQGQPLPERVTGSDGVPRIAQEAAKYGWKLFLLGAGPGIAEKAAQILIERNPGLMIVGTYEGSPAPAEEDAIVERVNASGADILLVAYGAPEQDKWIARNTPRLRVKMAMGIGGTLDFIAGVIPRAPESFRRMGLEWLYRLYLQPWRIKRMMRLPRFVIAVLLDRFFHPRRSRGRRKHT
ncbi:MAG: WecB/TagA/CpsF family glycosyltransferase [Anaerolineae bacterium]